MMKPPIESPAHHQISHQSDLQSFDNHNFVNLFDLWDVVVNNRKLIAIVTVLGVLLGATYLYFAIPTYEASTLIQVEESKPGNVTATSALGEAASLFEIRSPATAEIEIIRSRLVVGQAVQNLQLNLVITPKRIPLIGNWLARNATTISIPGFFGMEGYVTGNETLTVDSFEVPKQLDTQRFTVRITKSGFDLLSPGGQLLTNGQVGVIAYFMVNGHHGEILITDIVAGAGSQFYVQHLSPLAVVNALQRSLTIEEQGRQSGVIRTSLTGADPVKITEILNEIGTLYVGQNVARKSAVAEKTLSFLGTLLPELRAQVDDAASKFNDFRNRNNTFDLSNEAKADLEQSIKLQTSNLDLQQKRRELETRFGTKHPSIRAIDAQIKSVGAEIQNLNGKIKVFPDVEQELLTLTRDLKVNTELYTSLLNSFQQLRLVKEGNVGNVRIVDNAVIPEDPIRPQKPTVLAFAGLLGLTAGLAIAFIRNSLLAGVSDPSEIEQRTSLQVISTVPFSTLQINHARSAAQELVGKHILALDSPHDGAIESLRSFRTALQFSMLDTLNNLVLISGATPGIGKSFICLNLAVVLGANNKKYCCWMPIYAKVISIFLWDWRVKTDSVML